MPTLMLSPGCTFKTYNVVVTGYVLQNRIVSLCAPGVRTFTVCVACTTYAANLRHMLCSCVVQSQLKTTVRPELFFIKQNAIASCDLRDMVN